MTNHVVSGHPFSEEKNTDNGLEYEQCYCDTLQQCFNKVLSKKHSKCKNKLSSNYVKTSLGKKILNQKLNEAKMEKENRD